MKSPNFGTIGLETLKSKIRHWKRRLLYPLMLLKYKLVSLWRYMSHRNGNIGEESCPLCIHWKVCGVTAEKRNELLKWLDGPEDFCRRSATDCEDFFPEIDGSSQEDLLTLFWELRQGKIAILQQKSTGRIELLLGDIQNKEDAIDILGRDGHQSIIVTGQPAHKE